MRFSICSYWEFGVQKAQKIDNLMWVLFRWNYVNCGEIVVVYQIQRFGYLEEVGLSRFWKLWGTEIRRSEGGVYFGWGREGCYQDFEGVLFLFVYFSRYYKEENTVKKQMEYCFKFFVI